MSDLDFNDITVTISRRYFFGRGWKWKVQAGRSRIKGTAETEQDAQATASSVRWSLYEQSKIGTSWGNPRMNYK